MRPKGDGGASFRRLSFCALPFSLGEKVDRGRKGARRMRALQLAPNVPLALIAPRNYTPAPISTHAPKARHMFMHRTAPPPAIR